LFPYNKQLRGGREEEEEERRVRTYIMSTIRKKRGEVESDYIKYLKYKNTGFQVSSSDKTLVWWPTKETERAYVYAEVTKDDGKNFTVRLEDGQVGLAPLRFQHPIAKFAKFFAVELKILE